MKTPYQVILYPLRTEKSVSHQENSKYVFVVDRSANKVDIKRAIEEIYKVNVTRVNTINMLGKKRRVRLAEGKRSDWKKAEVTLKQGDVIELK